MMDAGSMRPLNPAEVQAASSLSSAQGVPATGGSPGGVLLILQNHQMLIIKSCAILRLPLEAAQLAISAISTRAAHQE